ncbi:hypothetical protein EV715DRAFT_287962 [Schizophyllum commune]
MAAHQPQKPLVFVTGASGYIAFAVVHELLEKGYRVRGSARGAKVATLQKVFAKYPLFEAVEVADIASSDLSEVFKGVDKLIHMAAPLVGRATPKEAVDLGVHGTVHVLNHAVAAGIKKIVVTGSSISYNLPDGPFGPRDFNSVTIEAASAPDADPWLAYAAEKTFTEKAVVDFGEKHPEIDISVIEPPFVFGAHAPGFEALVPPNSPASLSTMAFIYRLLQPDTKDFMPPFGCVDLRDVVRAHIAAMEIDTSALPVHERRFAIFAPYDTDAKEAIEYVAQQRPELKDRLATPQSHWVARQTSFGEADRARVEKTLGFRLAERYSWKDTVLDTVDALIALEKKWKGETGN